MTTDRDMMDQQRTAVRMVLYTDPRPSGYPTALGDGPTEVIGALLLGLDDVADGTTVVVRDIDGRVAGTAVRYAGAASASERRAMRRLVANDALAASCQSMGQYRTALLAHLAGGEP